MRKPNDNFLSLLAAPARRALERNGILTTQQLSKFTEKDILKFHGMGPSSIPKLRTALEAEGLTFKKSTNPEDENDYIHYHKDGSVWAKGKRINDIPEGYWEWFRKDGTKLPCLR